jgi:hypothetical protein
LTPEGNGAEIIGQRLWQRFLLGGKGPELSLTEAAAAIGVSVSKATRLISEGKLLARRDPAGRYRVIPVLNVAMGEDDNLNARIWNELRTALGRIDEVTRERDALRRSLDDAEEAARAAQEEIGRLWPLLTQVRAVAKPKLPPDPAIDLDLDRPLKGNGHVRSVVIDAREAFKKRRTHWPLVG